jgi:hypothetical protein
MMIEMLPQLIPIGVGIVKTIAKALIDNWPLILSSVQQLGAELINAIVAAFPGVGGIIGQVAGIAQELAANFMTMVRTVGPPLMAMFQTLGQTLLPPLMGLFQTFTSTVIPALTGILQKLMPVLAPILQIIGQIAGKLLELASAVIPPLMSALSGYASYIATVFGTLFSVIMPVIQNIQGILGGLIDFISGVFTGDWGKAWQGIQDIFSNIMAGLENILKAPLNAMISLINKAFAGMGAVKIPDWVPLLGGKTFALPQIPLLYTGTRNWPGGPAIVGDRGPELLNLPRGSDVYSSGETNSILSRARDFGETAANIVLKVINNFNGPVTKEEVQEAAKMTEQEFEEMFMRLKAKYGRLSFDG